MEIPFNSKRDSDSKPMTDLNDKRQEPVIAKVPQGFEAKIKIRLVPAVKIGNLAAVAKCQSRQNSGYHNPKPIDFSENIKKKFIDANKQVVDWLAVSSENADSFLKNPVEALLKANVQLTRPEQKELSKLFQEVSNNYIVAPGVEIKEILVSAHPKGKVGNIKKSKENKKGIDNDCGCQ